MLSTDVVIKPQTTKSQHNISTAGNKTKGSINYFQKINDLFLENFELTYIISVKKKVHKLQFFLAIMSDWHEEKFKFLSFFISSILIFFISPQKLTFSQRTRVLPPLSEHVR